MGLKQIVIKKSAVDLGKCCHECKLPFKQGEDAYHKSGGVLKPKWYHKNCWEKFWNV